MFAVASPRPACWQLDLCYCVLSCPPPSSLLNNICHQICKLSCKWSSVAGGCEVGRRYIKLEAVSGVRPVTPPVVWPLLYSCIVPLISASGSSYTARSCVIVIHFSYVWIDTKICSEWRSFSEISKWIVFCYGARTLKIGDKNTQVITVNKLCLLSLNFVTNSFQTFVMNWNK